MAKEISDYEKQYQEDLERAQALSLESLALEQFKNKRLQELNKSKNVTVSRTSSMNETDSNHSKNDRQQSNPRPRPGPSVGNHSSALIAPPPHSSRKNSSSIDTPDLISFANPPTSTDNILELCNKQNYSNNSVVTFPSTYMIQHNTYRPQVSSYPGNAFTNVQQQAWYRPAANNGNYCYSSNPRPIQIFQQQSNEFNKTSSAPALPPKNQQLPPPPIVLPSSKSSAASQYRKKTTATSKDLIDLAHSEDTSSVRVSILQEFDPILSSNDYSSALRTVSPECSADDCVSVCGSVYDDYDPYDIYTGSGGNSMADPLYAAVVKSEIKTQSPPPLPPRDRIAHSKTTLKLNLLDSVVKVSERSAGDSDLKAFYYMVKKVRNKYRYNQPDTNMGLIVSPRVNYEYKQGTSIKLCVYPDFEGADVTTPIFFTCDVTCSIEHITLQLTCDLDAPSKDKYTLKVWGSNEYLVPTTLLGDYEYVHNCIKLEEDIKLTLIPDSKIDRSFARTLQDDNRDRDLSYEDIVPIDTTNYFSYDKLVILLETVENELKKIEQAAVQIEQNKNPTTMPTLQPINVLQSVKCVINLMGNLCILELIQAVEDLQNVCKIFRKFREEMSFDETISSICNSIRQGIQNLIDLYSRTFKVDFEIKKSVSIPDIPRCISEISDSLVIHVCAIYRPYNDWKHDSFIVAAQVYHGTRPIGHPVLSPPCVKTDNDQLWPSRIIFDHWFEMLDVSINSLARESRLILVIYGRTLEASEDKDSQNEPNYKQEEIGWASLQFFNYEGMMVQGNLVLSIWPPKSQSLHGASPPFGTHPIPNHPLMDIQIATLSVVEFPRVPPDLISNVVKGDFHSLDQSTQETLKEICDQDMLHKLRPEIREVLWEKRHYLYHIPQALPKVLLAAHSWDYACLPDLHGMLHKWTRLEPIQALQLLLPTFPDLEVRKMAIEWLRCLSSDELVDYLPQLVIALRHEPYENSSLAEFLLDSALRSPRVAHYLFWLLSHTLPGCNPQNAFAELSEREEITIDEMRHHRRMKLMLRALLEICGEALRSCFLTQQVLVNDLNDIAEAVKKAKASERTTVLHNRLRIIDASLNENPTSLPLSPTLKVCGVQAKSSLFFPSNTLPLKISFLDPKETIIPAIYKVGDDLQQDMLTLQIIRLMDKLWLKSGLDLKMVFYGCIPTGKRRGMIEMVTNAETLRQIQMEYGLTGSFKDKPIAEWLAKFNPSELEYQRAVENFTASCAGYCVVTYILGVCDRHNDNIMLKQSGHLFHIDFGKFLGDAQMFGNFKRDRAPFVLTSDMAYVINGGDRPSEKFHKFIDLCCQAFNIVRENSNLFLYLFTMMASSGVCGITPESVGYVHRVLLLDKSNPEAAAYFARLIDSSLNSWFTQFNFFVHNLAQRKFSNDSDKGLLLSFVPKTYTMATDGKLEHVQVVGFEKRYVPEKNYVYVLRVYRMGEKSSMNIHRTYKEFCELHQKLCTYFPLAKLHSLTTSVHVGRSNIKQVALKRLQEVSTFITSLFKCANEIAHSDLVYTFFHPLLRDQQSPEEYIRKSKDKKSMKNEAGILKGQLRLSFLYSKGVFQVTVFHVRSLPLLTNGQEPSTYVKVYLRPDSSKETKRKTKVVKKSCHPSFVEMLEYRMPLDVIKEKTLQATVWNYDVLQENEFLGGVELQLRDFDLTVETSEWYPLLNLSR